MIVSLDRSALIIHNYNLLNKITKLFPLKNNNEKSFSKTYQKFASIVPHKWIVNDKKVSYNWLTNIK